MKVRKHIYFSGMVQGVGFRYRAFHLAEHLGLTGWVRNLYDERVEMEIQGEETQIFKLMEKLKEGNFVYITDIEIKEIRVEEEERSFRIAEDDSF